MIFFEAGKRIWQGSTCAKQGSSSEHAWVGIVVPCAAREHVCFLDGWYYLGIFVVEHANVVAIYIHNRIKLVEEIRFHPMCRRTAFVALDSVHPVFLPLKDSDPDFRL
jgi:hypothetical protein